MTERITVTDRGAEMLAADQRTRRERPAELLFPGCRAAIEDRVCMDCGNAVRVFRDKLSVKEYFISGLCQDCQDEVFG